MSKAFDYQLPSNDELHDDAQLVNQQQLEQLCLANDEIKQLVEEIKQIRAEEKNIKKKYEQAKTKLNAYMKEREILIDPSTGEYLLTWHYTADRMSFNEKEFKKMHPGLWEGYLERKPGHKMLVLKGE